MDRHPLSSASLLDLPPDADTFDEHEHAVAPPTRSAKIAELVRYLHAFEAGDKTLVFSQFTTFLDRVAAVLEAEGIAFCRFDGSMPAKKASWPTYRTLIVAPGGDRALPDAQDRGERGAQPSSHAHLPQVGRRRAESHRGQ